MSKMDGLRAMREAKYARAAAGAAQPSAPRTPKRPPVAPGADATPPASAPAGAPAQDTERLCGHRAISGRTCTREAGHAAKSHRYS